MEKNKKSEKVTKIDWNDMENAAIKFHKMFKDSEKILQAVKAAKAAENSIIDSKKQEASINASINELKDRQEELLKDNKEREASFESKKKANIAFSVEISKQGAVLESGCAYKKAELDKDFEQYKDGINAEYLDAKEKHGERIAEMDKELERKQKLIDSAENTLNRLKSKLG